MFGHVKYVFHSLLHTSVFTKCFLNSLNSVTKIFVITVKWFEVHDVISLHFHQRIANAVNDVGIQPMFIQAFQIFDQFDA